MIYENYENLPSPERVAQLDGVMSSVTAGLRAAIAKVRNTIAAERRQEVAAMMLGVIGLWLNRNTSTADAKTAVLSGLATMDNIVNRLETQSRREVLSGALAPEKWLASAEEVSKGIAAQARLLKDETTARMVDAQMADAKQEFANFLKSLAEGARAAVDTIKWPLFLGLGIVGAVFVSRILPQRTRYVALRGYRRRK